MTEQQAAWLREHPTYEVVPAGGVGPSGIPQPAADRYSWLQALAPDGTVSKVKAVAPSILVGIRKTVGAHPGGALGSK